MNVFRPASLGEGLDFLAADPAPVPMAGGTDLMVHWPVRPETRERDYLDVTAIGALRYVRWEEGELRLGALATYWDVIREPRAVAEFPLLVESARQVGAIQIQSRGTWAGNVVNASPAADGVPALMAYDATVVLESAKGREEVPLEDFYLGYKEMRRRPDQLITEIRLPRRPHDVQRFEKVGSRRAQAIAKVGLAVTHSAAGWRVVAASLAPTVRRCPALERLLAAEEAISAPEELLPAIRADVSPIDDIRSTAEYRELTFARVLYWSLREQAPGFGAA